MILLEKFRHIHLDMENLILHFGLKQRIFYLKNSEIVLNVQVTNAGKEYSGREVVQIYISEPDGRLEKPYQELAAYAKTKCLQPGESENMTISFPVSRMAFMMRNRKRGSGRKAAILSV